MASQNNLGKLSPFRLLLVEDNPADAELITECLSNVPDCKLHIIHADSLAAAMDLVQTTKPDGVILDLNLRDSSGVDSVRWLRCAIPRVPFVVLTGSADPRLRRHALEIGADELFGKTDPPEILLARSILQSIERCRVRDERDTLSTLLSSMPDAVLVVDIQGIVKFVNPAAKALFSLSPEDYAGELIGFTSPVGKAIEIELMHGSDRRVAEMRFVDIEWEGKPAYLAISRDISESKRRTEKGQARQSQKLDAMSRMAAGTAHDFKNMLTAVVAGLEYLFEQSALAAETEQVLYDMQSAVDRALVLSQQLISCCRDSPIQQEFMDLNALVSNYERVLRSMIRSTIDLIVEVETGSSLVAINATHCEQIILNLALNARDAISQRGRVRVQTRRVQLVKPLQLLHSVAPSGQYVGLFVSDDGVGMSDDTRVRIFEPFFTTKPTGTGVGLATVYGLVMQHNGFIDVATQSGRGTTFSVYFPRAGTISAKVGL